MSKSFKEWISEGESLYTTALKEFQTIEAQIEELEEQLNAKRDEVNQIAQVVGKSPVDITRKAPAVQIVDGHGPGSIPASRNTIAKALTGRGLG